MIEIKAPGLLSWDEPHAVFLAGSIEMGTAEDWQTKLVSQLSDYGVAILNPRRDHWDPSWAQSMTNPKFKEQVEWELEAISHADTVVFYFDPNTKSPITLLELGLCAGSGSHMIVCCPDGYWRKGNVEAVCHRYGVQLVTTLADLVYLLKRSLV